jgi:DNA-binding transcriptional LysR family regulator
MIVLEYEQSMDSASLDLNDLRLLMHVVDHGGFTTASRALGIPKSTLSQRIAALERAAGTGLLRRTTRSFSLTEAGKLLIPHARAIADRAQQAAEALLGLGESATGLLRVSCSITIAEYVLGPLMPAFLRGHPQIKVRIEASNRFVDLIGEGFDVGLRAHDGSLKDSTLIQRVIARTPWCLTASPAYVDQSPVITDPSDLSDTETLYFATTALSPSWRLTKEGTAPADVALSPRMSSDDMTLLKRAARDGAGVTALPCYIVHEELLRGDLVKVLQDWTLFTSTITLLTPPKSQSSQCARFFSDFVSHQISLLPGCSK